MAAKATCLYLAFASLTQGTMMCPTCISLDDLLAPGYGISVSLNGLSSAAAYHNGTLQTIGSIPGSAGYRALMSDIFEQHETYEPRSTALQSCLARALIAEPTPWDKDYLKLMKSYAGIVKQKIEDFFSDRSPEPPNLPLPLDPSEQMLQAQILSLPPFASMNASSLSRTTVSLQLPPWLIPSPYACSLLRIAEETFGRVAGLESAPSSAYTNLGHELCRVDQDAYECNGPGRLALFEYDGQLATVSVIKTPLDIFNRLQSRYATCRSSDPVELAGWIDKFLDAMGPLDMTTVVSSSNIFQDALDLLSKPWSVQPSDSVVKGAAQTAKDALENHNTDCEEFSECFEIRREADRIAGKYRHLWPKVWPAVNNRHWRAGEGEEHFEVYRSGYMIYQ